jgi:hypothetical protein
MIFLVDPIYSALCTRSAIPPNAWLQNAERGSRLWPIPFFRDSSRDPPHSLRVSPALLHSSETRPEILRTPLEYLRQRSKIFPSRWLEKSTA